MARLNSDNSGTGNAYGSDYGSGAGCGYSYSHSYGDGGDDCGAYGWECGDGAGDGRGNSYDRRQSVVGPVVEYGMERDADDGYGHGIACGRFPSGGGEEYNDAARDYWTAAIDVFASRWPQLWRERLAAARARGAVIAYWRSDALARPCNGGYGDPVHAGKFERNSGPLRLCAGGTLHATLLPPAYRGERCWIVAMYGETVQDGEKIGALRREIIGEII